MPAMSFRSAIGAIVTVEAAALKQTDALLSQSSFLSHNDARLHYGLGNAARVDRITVRWPRGSVEEFGSAPADRLLLLVEGSGKVDSLPLVK